MLPTVQISTFLENCGGVKRIGTPEKVVQKSYQAHNLMILASTARPATKLNKLRLIKWQLLRTTVQPQEER